MLCNLYSCVPKCLLSLEVSRGIPRNSRVQLLFPSPLASTVLSHPNSCLLAGIQRSSCATSVLRVLVNEFIHLCCDFCQRHPLLYNWPLCRLLRSFFFIVIHCQAINSCKLPFSFLEIVSNYIIAGVPFRGTRSISYSQILSIVLEGTREPYQITPTRKVNNFQLKHLMKAQRLCCYISCSRQQVVLLFVDHTVRTCHG